MKLRFALLFNGKTLERWHFRCLDHLEPVAHLAAVIVAPEPSACTSKQGVSILMRLYARCLRNRAALDVTRRFEDISKFALEGTTPTADAAGFDFVLKLGCVV